MQSLLDIDRPERITFEMATELCGKKESEALYRFTKLLKLSGANDQTLTNAFNELGKGTVFAKRDLLALMKSHEKKFLEEHKVTRERTEDSIEALFSENDLSEILKVLQQMRHDSIRVECEMGMRKMNGSLPANFRLLILEVDGVLVQVGAMARPSGYHLSGEGESLVGFPILRAIRKGGDFDHLVSLQDEEKLIEKSIQYFFDSENNGSGSDHSKLILDEHTPPTYHQFDSYYNLLIENSRTGKRTMTHCEEGFGRTGAMLTSLVLRDLILKSPELGNREPDNEGLVKIELGRCDDTLKSVRVTPTLARALETVRSLDPEEGDTGGGTIGRSVENTNQIQGLIKYERILRGWDDVPDPIEETLEMETSFFGQSLR